MYSRERKESSGSAGTLMFTGSLEEAGSGGSENTGNGGTTAAETPETASLEQFMVSAFKARPFRPKRSLQSSTCSKSAQEAVAGRRVGGGVVGKQELEAKGVEGATREKYHESSRPSSTQSLSMFGSSAAWRVKIPGGLGGRKPHGEAGLGKDPRLDFGINEVTRHR